MSHFQYVGRFAPSPSGALHFGSLVAALGSYLQARSSQGRWLVRIEDIDPSREMPGADVLILRQLEHYGLYWDGEVLYQSQRASAYLAALDWLKNQRLCYYCSCNRERIRQLGGIYDGHCRWRVHATDQVALRLKQQHPVYQFTDRLCGQVTINAALAEEDFIIHRRDGLFAYNLAVVVDDHFQGISEVVRGADLLEPTARQISLYQTFGWSVPAFCHLPLARDAGGQKLSKQNHAPALSPGDGRATLVRALQFLHQLPPPGWQDLTVTQLLAQAVAGWQPERLVWLSG